MNLDEIEVALQKAKNELQRTSTDAFIINKRLIKRTNKVITLESKKRQILKNNV